MDRDTHLLIGRAYDNLQSKREHDQLVQEAKEMVPELRVTIKGFIDAQFPDTNDGQLEEDNTTREDFVASVVARTLRLEQLSVDCRIPVEDSSIDVKISSSRTGIGQEVFKVGLSGLDEQLVVSGYQATIESKARAYTPISDFTPIGPGHNPNGPATSRPSLPSDIEAYSSLIDLCANSPEVGITVSTNS